MPVHLDPEEAWRKGLETRGTHWVTAELARLPGRPDDPLFDVVFVPPHPSRAFCQRWCAEDESRIRVAPTALLALVFLILAVICVGRAVVGFSRLADSHAAQAQAGSVAAPPRTGSIMPSTSLGSSSAVAAGQSSVGGQTGTQTAGTQTASSPSGNTATSASLPSVCGYQSYASARCRAQP
jgi:hypothetical protein